MKVAVVSAHYLPDIGYQEVHLARAYARLHHEVKVFTSAASVALGGDLGNESYSEGTGRDERYDFEVLRLPALAWKSKAFSFKLRDEVKKFKPDLIVLLGVAKGFPFPLLNKEVHGSCKIVSLYGDAQEYLDRKTLSQKIKALKHDLGYTFIKEPLYKRAVRYCHRIVLNIPESDSYFRSFLRGRDLKLYEQKRMMLNLGFDPDDYYFDAETRSARRTQLGITQDEVVLITSTRINKRKNLESVVVLVNELNKKGKKIKYILIGFLDDAYERELKAFIAGQEFSGSFLCFPFLKPMEIRKMYCAADAGIWLKAAISIQEAMGTGLPVILEDKASVNHLISDKHNGWFFTPDNFSEIVTEAVAVLANENKDRKKLSDENGSWLSYDVIATKILESVQ
jgi:glycosyltransferase involved in cell wall biosynthesis